MDWKKCDVCGKSPIVSECDCDHCFARYCSEECKKKDVAERKDVGAKFPLANHTDFCPKLYDEEKGKIQELFSHDNVSLKVFGTTWHALPGPISEEIPHAFIKKGDLCYKELLKVWFKIRLRQKEKKKSVKYFVTDQDAARVMLFRLSQVQSNEILEFWEKKA